MNLIFKRPNVLTLPLLLVLSLGLVTDSNAQIRGNEEEEEPILIEQEDLDELRLWIERDQKYEKVLFKAIRFIEDDEQKKHPVPYLFMSMAYFGIHNSDDAELRETYQVEKMKALKNACKYASKFVKKDKENDFVPQDQDYLDELRRETMDAANAEWDIEKYSKAKSYYKYLSDIDTEDPGAKMMFGTCVLLMGDRRQADEIWEETINLLENQQARGLTSNQQLLLRVAFDRTIEAAQDQSPEMARRFSRIQDELPMSSGR